ncbi:MAG: hypothetical protein GY750_19855 [Lentisphaerae bacterium]|nr:hypothetical protein [Lentisphaerota bacterium]
MRKVFTTTEEILKDPDARAELLSNAIREALAFRRRYSQLSELANVIRAIDDSVGGVAL